MSTSPRESATRKTIDRILENLGWNVDESSPDCNVFTERAKTETQQAKLKGRQPDYILYEPGTNNAIAVIEAKRPGTTLVQALKQAVERYAEPLQINVVFASDGAIVESFDRRSGNPLSLDGEPITDFLPVSQLLKFARQGPDLTSPTISQQTKQELMNVFKQVNELLRKEGLQEGIQRFTEFSNLLFLKLISEIEADREESGEVRQLEARYCWESFSKKPAHEMLDYINDTVLRRLVDSYNHSGDVFQRNLKITNATTLKKIVDKLSDLQLLNTDSDIKGDAFEYFLKHSITVGNDLGEYFTPRHIVKLIVELIDPKYQETVYDPCCGTGGFLIEAFRHISEKVKKTSETRNVLENETIYGREITDTARIAKMNMILAGDGHTNIHQMDALMMPVSDEHGVVLTNFPFSQRTDYGNLYGFDTDLANPAFLKHTIDACEPGGRVGVIVPEGLLFDENRHCVKIRRLITESCNIDAIIALHEYVFRPYAGQPTSILILTKGQQTSRVWFFDADSDGFKKTASQKGRPAIADENKLMVLRRIWNEKPESDSSFWIDIAAIRANHYKLSMSSYRTRTENLDWLPLGGPDGVCDILIGATPKSSVREHFGGKHVWVKIGDIADEKRVTESEQTLSDLGVENSSVKLLCKGTVLLSFKLTIGKVAIAGTDLYTNEAIAGIVPKDERVMPLYLFYILPEIDFESFAQPAAKGKTLNKRILEAIRIPVPPIEDQQEFVSTMQECELVELELQNQLRQNRIANAEVVKRHLETAKVSTVKHNQVSAGFA